MWVYDVSGFEILDTKIQNLYLLLQYTYKLINIFCLKVRVRVSTFYLAFLLRAVNLLYKIRIKYVKITWNITIKQP